MEKRPGAGGASRSRQCPRLCCKNSLAVPGRSRTAADYGLPIVHHSSTWNPPYYPGHDDMWDNIFLGRLASHPWGAMRFVAAFIGGGILDRHPSLRFGTLECGFGWLPFWAKRMCRPLRSLIRDRSTAAAWRLRHGQPAVAMLARHGGAINQRGKGAITWTRLSRRTFAANAIRLQLR